MSLDLPDFLIPVMELIAGNEFPQGDEDRTWRRADGLDGAADRTLDSTSGYVTRVGVVAEAVDGPTGDRFRDYADRLVGFSAANADAARGLASAVRDFGDGMVETKFFDIVMAVQTLFDLETTMWNPFTVELVPAIVAAAQVLVREQAVSWGRRVVAEAAMVAGKMAALQLAMDGLVQLVSVAEGWSPGFNMKEWLMSGVMGAVGGLVHLGAMHGVEKVVPGLGETRLGGALIGGVMGAALPVLFAPVEGMDKGSELWGALNGAAAGGLFGGKHGAADHERLNEGVIDDPVARLPPGLPAVPGLGVAAVEGPGPESPSQSSQSSRPEPEQLAPLADAPGLELPAPLDETVVMPVDESAEPYVIEPSAPDLPPPDLPPPGEVAEAGPSAPAREEQQVPVPVDVAAAHPAERPVFPLGEAATGQPGGRPPVDRALPGDRAETIGAGQGEPLAGPPPGRGVAPGRDADPVRVRPGGPRPMGLPPGLGDQLVGGGSGRVDVAGTAGSPRSGELVPLGAVESRVPVDGSPVGAVPVDRAVQLGPSGDVVGRDNPVVDRAAVDGGAPPLRVRPAGPRPMGSPPWSGEVGRPDAVVESRVPVDGVVGRDGPVVDGGAPLLRVRPAGPRPMGSAPWSGDVGRPVRPDAVAQVTEPTGGERGGLRPSAGEPVPVAARVVDSPLGSVEQPGPRGDDPQSLGDLVHPSGIADSSPGSAVEVVREGALSSDAVDVAARRIADVVVAHQAAGLPLPEVRLQGMSHDSAVVRSRLADEVGRALSGRSGVDAGGLEVRVDERSAGGVGRVSVEVGPRQRGESGVGYWLGRLGQAPDELVRVIRQDPGARAVRPVEDLRPWVESELAARGAGGLLSRDEPVPAPPPGHQPRNVVEAARAAADVVTGDSRLLGGRPGDDRGAHPPERAGESSSAGRHGQDRVEPPAVRARVADDRPDVVRRLGLDDEVTRSFGVPHADRVLDRMADLIDKYPAADPATREKFGEMVVRDVQAVVRRADGHAGVAKLRSVHDLLDDMGARERTPSERAALTGRSDVDSPFHDSPEFDRTVRAAGDIMDGASRGEAARARQEAHELLSRHDDGMSAADLIGIGDDRRAVLAQASEVVAAELTVHGPEAAARVAAALASALGMDGGVRPAHGDGGGGKGKERAADPRGVEPRDLTPEGLWPERVDVPVSHRVGAAAGADDARGRADAGGYPDQELRLEVNKQLRARGAGELRADEEIPAPPPGHARNIVDLAGRIADQLTGHGHVRGGFGGVEIENRRLVQSSSSLQYNDLLVTRKLVVVKVDNAAQGPIFEVVNRYILPLLPGETPRARGATKNATWEQMNQTIAALEHARTGTKLRDLFQEPEDDFTTLGWEAGTGNVIAPNGRVVHFTMGVPISATPTSFIHAIHAESVPYRRNTQAHFLHFLTRHLITLSMDFANRMGIDYREDASGGAKNPSVDELDVMGMVTLLQMHVYTSLLADNIAELLGNQEAGDKFYMTLAPRQSLATIFDALPPHVRDWLAVHSGDIIREIRTQYPNAVRAAPNFKERRGRNRPDLTKQELLDAIEDSATTFPPTLRRHNSSLEQFVDYVVGRASHPGRIPPLVVSAEGSLDALDRLSPAHGSVPLIAIEFRRPMLNVMDPNGEELKHGYDELARVITSHFELRQLLTDVPDLMAEGVELSRQRSARVTQIVSQARTAAAQFHAPPNRQARDRQSRRYRRWYDDVLYVLMGQLAHDPSPMAAANLSRALSMLAGALGPVPR